MLPASTISPPNDFTPRRRPAESRPLRDDPPAFLWAMVLLRSSVFYRDSAANAHHFLLSLSSGADFAAAGFFAAVFAGFFAAVFAALGFAVASACAAGAASASTADAAAGPAAAASSVAGAASAACGRSVRVGLRPS